MQKIVISKPIDAHLHVRDGQILKTVMPDVCKRFAKAIIMPNLQPPVVTPLDAKRYHQAILQACPPGTNFTPLMTLYLHPQTTPEMVEQVAKDDTLLGFKLYPQGVTTNAEHGICNYAGMYPVFEAMSLKQVPLLIHGEATSPHVDTFDKESMFINTVLASLVERFPKLPMVLEHISTRDAIAFIKSTPSNVAATITCHHLHLNRNDVISTRIKPHHFCLPIPKRRDDQEALIQAATSGHPNFFLGTDSAPHLQSQKEQAEGCAGIYTSHCALELYADIFSSQDKLEHLDDFASGSACRFYGLEQSNERITLHHKEQAIPKSIGDPPIIPLYAGQTIPWSIEDAAC